MPNEAVQLTRPNGGLVADLAVSGIEEERQVESLTSAGFLLVVPSLPPTWPSGNLLPKEIISASTCLCSQFPGPYALAETRISDDERAGQFDCVGIPPAMRSAALAWASENLEKS